MDGTVLILDLVYMWLEDIFRLILRVLWKTKLLTFCIVENVFIRPHPGMLFWLNIY